MFYFVPEYSFEWLGVVDFSLRAVDTKYECVHKEGSLNKFCRHYSIYQRTRQGKKEKADSSSPCVQGLDSSPRLKPGAFSLKFGKKIGKVGTPF